MPIIIYSLIALLLGAGITAIAAYAIIRQEKQHNQQLQADLHKLQQQKELLMRQEATTAAQLLHAEQALNDAKEQAQKELEKQKSMFQTELELARESMRTHFQQEMNTRTEQFKQTNTEHMMQIVAPLKRELDLLRELVAQSKESSDKSCCAIN